MNAEPRRVRRRVKGPRSDGARALDDWLVRHGITVPDFCSRAGLDRFVVQGALSGRVRSVSLDLAFAVQVATRGDVAARSWASTTVRWDSRPATVDPVAADDVVPPLDKASGE